MKLKSSIWIWPLRNVVNLSIRNKNILNPQKLGILCKYSITKHYDNVPDSFRVTEKWRTDQRAPRRPTPSYHYCTHLTWSQLMNKSWYDISNKSSCFIPISSFSNLSVPGAHPESFVIFCPHQLVLLWTVTVSETSSALVATTVWRSTDQAGTFENVPQWGFFLTSPSSLHRSRGFLHGRPESNTQLITSYQTRNSKSDSSLLTLILITWLRQCLQVSPPASHPSPHFLSVLFGKKSLWAGHT